MKLFFSIRFFNQHNYWLQEHCGARLGPQWQYKIIQSTIGKFGYNQNAFIFPLVVSGLSV